MDEPERPDLDGYLVHRLLGRGASAQVWSATAPDGSDVALKVVRGPAGAAAAFAEAALLCEVDHPHVLRVRAVEQRDGAVVLVLDRAPGGSLGALVRARGALDVAEVVGLVTTLAGALADLHARGLVHGDVTPGNVLFTADATPLLADWGLAAVAGRVAGVEPAGTPGFADPARAPDDDPTPAGDVHGLGALALHALTGQVPPRPSERVPLPLLVPEVPAALAALLDAATSPLPGRRPSAAELAEGCAATGPAAPVHLVPSDEGAGPAELLTHRLRAAAARADADAVEGGGRRAGRSTRLWRSTGRALAGLAAAGAVFAGAWAVSGAVVGPGGWLEARAAAASDDVRSQPARPPAEPAEPPGRRAVSDLATQRARAFAEADVALLAAVDAPGSPAADVDRAAITAMRQEGTRVRGLSYDVRSAELVDVGEASGPGATAVRATVVTSAHEQVMPDGSVVQVPASAPVTSVLLLERAGGRWLVAGTA